MFLRRHALSALALLVATPVLSMIGAGTAEAGGGLRFSARGPARVDIMPDGRVYGSRQSPKYGQCWVFAGVTSTLGRDGVGTSGTATVKSDAGSEDVALLESDAWLHGAATISALPKTDAALTLTLYDNASASLLSFSGTLGADGTVSLTADATKDAGSTCDTSSKTACTSDASSAAIVSPDVEVLAAELFAVSKGYDVSLDLAGADTYEVAYAEITIDETVTTTSTDPSCATSSYDKKGSLCALSGVVRSKAEVGWDDIGAVWAGDLTLDHEGAVDMKVKAYDSKGAELESTKASLGVPWVDGGDGVNVLATDEDPMTSVGFAPSCNRFSTVEFGCAESPTSARRLVVNSGGWSGTSTLPTEAKVELTNGGTITMSSLTLARLRKRPEILFHAWDDTFNSYIADDSSISISGGNFEISGVTLLDLEPPVCSNGICVSIVTDNDGRYDLSVSTYATTVAALAKDFNLVVSVSDAKGTKLASETVSVAFDDEISVIFANEISFTQDPIGLDLSGKVSLLGAKDKKGTQKTLSKGYFYGTFSRDGDGDLGLAGAEKEKVSSSGSIVVAGKSVSFELTTDTDKDGVLNPPPLTPVFGNGSGTKNVASQTSTKPELL